MKTLALVPAFLGVALATSSVTPVVQVRDDSNAPTIGIIGWQAGEAEFGLRTRLRRDGSHLGEGRANEHRLYMNTAFSDAKGGVSIATAHTGKVLRNAGEAKDVDACRFGACSPSQTTGLAVPDDLLRANRDSLVVTLRPKTGRSWVIRFDGSLINAYLGTVDSVAAALKK
jgi:hypothetical protein